MTTYQLDEIVVQDWLKSEKPLDEILRRLDVARAAGVAMAKHVQTLHTLLAHMSMWGSL